MTLSRRRFFGILAAPAIVKVGSLMALPRAPWPPLIATPEGLLLANGALLDARVYPELFSVMGHTYGGNLYSFRLPDLGPLPGLYRDRPLHSLINNAPENGPVGMVVFG